MDQTQVLGNWTSGSEDILTKSFPVHRACRDGDVQQLASLLSAGEVDLYEEDDFYGWTPIHWAAYFGKLSCLMSLLDHGANCDVPTERLNQTPAHIAAYGGYSHCLKWLLHCGATINRQLACLRRLINTLECQGNNGCDLVSSKFYTSTHLCAYADHPQCLSWLIKSGCDIDAQDYMGETPSHKAARTGSMECVSLLVSQGAKLSIRNYSGCTSSQVAMAAGFTECANYLERAMQIQCQATGVYDEMRTPVTHPTCSGTSPIMNPLNTGRESPEGQSVSKNQFISTNTYHSNPHCVTNGSAHDPLANPHFQNELAQVDNNNQSEDCDMEMDDVEGAHGGRSQSCPDVLLYDGVSKNVVPLAGRKRGREEAEEECFKRARNDEPLDMKYKLSGWLYNNSHLTNNVTDHVMSTDNLANQQTEFDHVTSQVTQSSNSMEEHYSSVITQQGYDSMMLESLNS